MASDPLSPYPRVGILGGGQLGRMLCEAALPWDLPLNVMDPHAQAPCASLAHTFMRGDLQDEGAIFAFAADLDILTLEIEHVNVEALFALEKKGLTIRPSPALIATIQNKAKQKRFYADQGIPTAPFTAFSCPDEIPPPPNFPVVYKTAMGGYDGKGVQILQRIEDFHALPRGVPGLVEDFIDDALEIAIIVARNADGQEAVYDPVQMDFHPEANLVDTLFAPAKIPSEQAKKAQSIALKCARALKLEGLMAVELFVKANGEILVNECAPRPHNSGHHTIEAAMTSQYQQHLRAILNWPLGETTLMSPAAMVNLLGQSERPGPTQVRGLPQTLSQSGIHVHIYGKIACKKMRKMGHITALAPSLDDAITRARAARQRLAIIAGHQPPDDLKKQGDQGES